MAQFHLLLFVFIVFYAHKWAHATNINLFQNSCQTLIGTIGIASSSTPFCYPLSNGNYVNVWCSGTYAYSYSTYSTGDCSVSNQLTPWQQQANGACVPSLNLGIGCPLFTPVPASTPLTSVPAGSDYRLYMFNDYCMVYTTSSPGVNGQCIQLGYNSYTKVYCSGSSGSYTIATYTNNQCVTGQEVIPFQQYSGTACVLAVNVAVQCALVTSTPTTLPPPTATPTITPGSDFIMTAYTDNTCVNPIGIGHGFFNGECFQTGVGTYSRATCTGTSTSYSVTLYTGIAGCETLVTPSHQYDGNTCVPTANIIIQCFIVPPTTQPPPTAAPTIPPGYDFLLFGYADTDNTCRDPQGVARAVHNGQCVQTGVGAYAIATCTGTSTSYSITLYAGSTGCTNIVTPLHQYSGTACVPIADITIQCAIVLPTVPSGYDFLLGFYTDNTCAVLSTNPIGYNNGVCFQRGLNQWATVTCSNTGSTYSVITYSSPCTNVITPLTQYSTTICIPNFGISVRCAIVPPTTRPPTTLPPTTQLPVATTQPPTTLPPTTMIPTTHLITTPIPVTYTVPPGSDFLATLYNDNTCASAIATAGGTNNICLQTAIGYSAIVSCSGASSVYNVTTYLGTGCLPNNVITMQYPYAGTVCIPRVGITIQCAIIIPTTAPTPSVIASSSSLTTLQWAGIGLGSLVGTVVGVLLFNYIRLLCGKGVNYSQLAK